MAQKIKDLLKNESKESNNKLSAGHQKRFESRLNIAFPKKKQPNYFLRIAASIVLLLTVGIASYQFLKNDDSQVVASTSNNKTIRSIADISPELKKIETYYLANIKYQYLGIKVTDDNKEFLEIYFSELSSLQKEYERLNADLSKEDISEATIDALIENLQKRLLLIRQLKKNLKTLENLKNKQNENTQA